MPRLRSGNRSGSGNSGRQNNRHDQADLRNGQEENDAADFDAAGRARVLHENLVIRFRNDRGKEVEPDSPGPIPKSGAAHLSGFVDGVTSLGGVAFSAGGVVKDANIFFTGDYDKKADKGVNIGSMANSGVAALNGIYKSISLGNKFSREKDGDKKDADKKLLWGNIASVFSNGLLSVSSGMKGFGDPDDKGGMNKANWVGAAGSAVGFLGNLSTYYGNKGRRTIHNSIADRAKELMAEDAPDLDGIEESSMPRGNREKQAKTNRKARKYAMSAAAAFNRIKANNTYGGILGMIGSASTFSNSLMKVLVKDSFLKSKWGLGLSLAFSAINTVAKTADATLKASNAIDQKKRFEEKKTEAVNSYLARKMNTLEGISADQMYGSATEEERALYGGNDAVLTVNEKKRILIGRLGMGISISDSDLNEEEMNAAFFLLARKRARNILESTERNTLLKALKLNPEDNPTIEEVVAAMTGEIPPPLPPAVSPLSGIPHRPILAPPPPRPDEAGPEIIEHDQPPEQEALPHAGGQEQEQEVPMIDPNLPPEQNAGAPENEGGSD